MDALTRLRALRFHTDKNCAGSRRRNVFCRVFVQRCANLAHGWWMRMAAVSLARKIVSFSKFGKNVQNCVEILVHLKTLWNVVSVIRYNAVSLIRLCAQTRCSGVQCASFAQLHAACVRTAVWMFRRRLTHFWELRLQSEEQRQNLQQRRQNLQHSNLHKASLPCPPYVAALYQI